MNKKSNNTITITASASYINTGPRKANLILKSIIGQNPQSAIEVLKFVPNRASKFVIKLLKQAIGNAADQYKLAPSDLTISQAYATKASASRRMRFAGRGRTQPYYKTTSHMTVILKAKLTPSPAPKKAPSGSKKETKSAKTTKKVNTKTKIK